MLQCYTVILVWVVSVAHSKIGDKRYVVWVEDAMFFRIGTCGGINLPPGTVVVSEGALDGKLEPVHENVR